MSGAKKPLVKIISPRAPQGGGAAHVRSVFVASGRVEKTYDGKPITGVRGVFTPTGGGTMPQVKTLRFKPLGNARSAWVIVFVGATSGSFTVECYVQDHPQPVDGGASRSIEAVEKLIGVDHPPVVQGGYGLDIDEKDYFVAYGSTGAPDEAISAASMDDGQTDYVGPPLPNDDQIWVATFTGLSGGPCNFRADFSSGSSTGDIPCIVPGN